jgi:hypothetical protein
MGAQACESCGREFVCGAQSPGPCWCDAVELGPDRVAILREHFERCLCPDCLALTDQSTPAGACDRIHSRSASPPTRAYTPGLPGRAQPSP